MGCSSSKDTPASALQLSGTPAELLGDTLLGPTGPVEAQAALAGKVVGLYFSAHWCPPCRGFTPLLAEAYSAHLKGKGLEIVFVSSDRGEKEFNEYFATMPWLALPLADRARKEALSRKFKVGGIPTLVLLDEQGNVLSSNARGKVTEDPEGKSFPWTPQPLKELLATPLLGGREIEGKVVGLYFSAHWCPPCQMFTPKLAEQYKKIQAAGLPFEVVFVSSDQSEEQFQSYYAEMPWLALPYEQQGLKRELSERFGVSGIPSLVLLDAERQVITKNGRGAVFQDLAAFPWHPEPVQDLAETMDGLNDTPSVVVLSSDAGAQRAAKLAMQPLAEECHAAGKQQGQDPATRFFVAEYNKGPVAQVQKLCGLSPTGLQVVLLDVQDNGSFYLPKIEPTTEGIRKMLADFKQGKLAKKQLKR